MKGWQATLALVGSLALGVGLWFGFLWLGAPSAPPQQIAAAGPAAPNLDAPAALPEAPPAPSGIAQAIAPGAGPDAPPHAYTIAQQADDLAALLGAAPWISRGNKGPALYIVAFRACPACEVVREREVPRLETGGIDVRWILYARRDKNGETRSTPEELAAVAELSRARDPTMLDAWFRDSQALLPAHDKAPDPAAAIEAGRALVDRLNGIVTANALPFAVPALFWKEGGMWRSYIGYDEQTFAEVRASLGLAPVAGISGTQQP